MCGGMTYFPVFIHKDENMYGGMIQSAVLYIGRIHMCGAITQSPIIINSEETHCWKYDSISCHNT